MSFNIFNWLFQDPITAGGPNSDGSEVFHYFWPYLIFCGVGLLIWFYYWVEGRKRFVSSNKLPNARNSSSQKSNRAMRKKRFVDSNKPLKDMLDLYLNWLAIICFIGIPIDLAREVLDSYFFAWRFWRYLWLVALLVWAVLWIVYLVRIYPERRARRKAVANFLEYVPDSTSEANAKPKKLTPRQRHRKEKERGRR